MDLKKFKFPVVTNLDMAFPTFNAIPELLDEARARGFVYGKTPYNKKFSDLFYLGGTVEFKKDLNENFKKDAWAYCRAFMGSYAPKHEHKEAICAMLMSELIEP